MLQQQPGTFVWQQWIQVQNVKGEAGEVEFKPCQQQVLQPRQARPQKSAKLQLIKKWKMLKQPKNWRCLNTGWQDRSSTVFMCLAQCCVCGDQYFAHMSQVDISEFCQINCKIGCKKPQQKNSKHLYSLMLAWYLSQKKKKKITVHIVKIISIIILIVSTVVCQLFFWI